MTAGEQPLLHHGKHVKSRPQTHTRHHVPQVRKNRPIVEIRAPDSLIVNDRQLFTTTRGRASSSHSFTSFTRSSIRWHRVRMIGSFCFILLASLCLVFPEQRVDSAENSLCTQPCFKKCDVGLDWFVREKHLPCGLAQACESRRHCLQWIPHGVGHVDVSPFRPRHDLRRWRGHLRTMEEDVRSIALRTGAFHEGALDHRWVHLVSHDHSVGTSYAHDGRLRERKQIDLPPVWVVGGTSENGEEGLEDLERERHQVLQVLCERGSVEVPYQLAEVGLGAAKHVCRPAGQLPCVSTPLSGAA
mmetsp:Transcript_17514/g.43603  ORF Transcript_17514/g.43603 Transcript_17514/m.43603 type:complete len:301 (-) Transcript_17514:800-1702(-)